MVAHKLRKRGAPTVVKPKDTPKKQGTRTLSEGSVALKHFQLDQMFGQLERNDNTAEQQLQIARILKALVGNPIKIKKTLLFVESSMSLPKDGVLLDAKVDLPETCTSVHKLPQPYKYELAVMVSDFSELALKSMEKQKRLTSLRVSIRSQVNNHLNEYRKHSYMS